ncbi:UNVERIFIED_CONTAM: hypothetical protein Sindi_0715000 [Sesamum indicum]
MSNPIGFQVTYSNKLQPQKRKAKVLDAGEKEGYDRISYCMRLERSCCPAGHGKREEEGSSANDGFQNLIALIAVKSGNKRESVMKSSIIMVGKRSRRLRQTVLIWL